MRFRGLKVISEHTCIPYGYGLTDNTGGLQSTELHHTPREKCCQIRIMVPYPFVDSKDDRFALV